MIEPAAEQRAIAQFRDQGADISFVARDRAVDALMGQQHAAFQVEPSTDRPQRLPDLAEVRQGCKLVESGDGEGHGGGLSGGWGGGNPSSSRRTPAPIHRGPSIGRWSQRPW